MPTQTIITQLSFYHPNDKQLLQDSQDKTRFMVLAHNYFVYGYPIVSISN